MNKVEFGFASYLYWKIFDHIIQEKELAGVTLVKKKKHSRTIARINTKKDCSTHSKIMEFSWKRDKKPKGTNVSDIALAKPKTYSLTCLKI